MYISSVSYLLYRESGEIIRKVEKESEDHHFLSKKTFVKQKVWVL